MIYAFNVPLLKGTKTRFQIALRTFLVWRVTVSFSLCCVLSVDAALSIKSYSWFDFWAFEQWKQSGRNLGGLFDHW